VEDEQSPTDFFIMDDTGPKSVRVRLKFVLIRCLSLTELTLVVGSYRGLNQSEREIGRVFASDWLWSR